MCRLVVIVLHSHYKPSSSSIAGLLMHSSYSHFSICLPDSHSSVFLPATAAVGFGINTETLLNSVSVYRTALYKLCSQHTFCAGMC